MLSGYSLCLITLPYLYQHLVIAQSEAITAPLPTNPSKCTQKANSNSSKPLELFKPSKSLKSSKPSKPIDPSKPSNPSKSLNPSRPKKELKRDELPRAVSKQAPCTVNGKPIH